MQIRNMLGKGFNKPNNLKLGGREHDDEVQNSEL